MTNEPTTEVFFAVELLNDGSLQIHREEVPWTKGVRTASVPEIFDIASRLAKELDRHILVDQVVSQLQEVVESIIPPQEIPFSSRVVEALKERGITTSSDKDAHYFPFPLRPGGKGKIFPSPLEEKNE